MRSRVILALLACLTPFGAMPGLPINSNVALNPYEGGSIVRIQTISTRARLDNRADSTVSVPFALVHGFTARFSLLVVIPYAFRRVTTNPPVGSLAPKTQESTSGFPDARLVGKYIFFQDDWKGGTFRWALPAGVTVPTRESGFSSGTYSGIIGQVLSYQTLGWEVDADFAVQAFAVEGGRKPGNKITYDLAFQYRLLPWTLPDDGIPTYFNLVLEINAKQQNPSTTGGQLEDNTGGRILYFSPGLQIAGERVVVEASYQKPISQQWTGNSPGARVQFTVEESVRFGIRVLL